MSGIVPATHKKATCPGTVGPGGGEGEYGVPRGGDHDGYRSKKDEAALGEYRPQFADAGRIAPRE